MFAAVAAFLLLAWSPGNHANIEILTHEQTDLNPHKVQAAIDLGLVGISVLYTWTSNLTR
ncbi:hypothetical protein [Sphingomonas sp. AOB5]|uniref:hypothetical protein n=1 Tax=Sphingomonas sp. AOB5 TaxID=3034017 RepID=UPI0023F6676B|nr:hypothetical protein [Sphingomonas sp. AOB5]